MSEPTLFGREEGFADHDLFLLAALGACSLGAQAKSWVASAIETPSFEESVLSDHDFAQWVDALLGVVALSGILQVKLGAPAERHHTTTPTTPATRGEPWARLPTR